MGLRAIIAGISLVAAMATIGCEPSGRKAQARPPADGRNLVTLAYPLPLDPQRALRASRTLLAPGPRPAADVLIGAVNAAFRSGQQNLRDGHLEKARRDFDRAVDWMLLSGIPLDSDPRLEKLFNHVVGTIHAYELAAFREGDGFTEQRPEPAPLDEIAEMAMPPADPGAVRAGAEALDMPHDLPLVVNQYVQTYLDFFQTPRGRTIVEQGMKRAGRYREMISRVLREEGLPQDLIYLAQAESAFKPQALSRAGARGIWQFMPWRGQEYGLKRSWWVDERKDPEKSTRAAARHLRDLYEIFGDWYLALAAYNSGPGNVSRGIQRTGYADFWELYRRSVLPRETRNYVPIILALTILAKDPQRYGFQVNPDAPIRTDRVAPGRPLDLRVVAELVDVPLETLQALNPQLLRMVTPPDAEFELSLPEGAAERFYAELAEIPEQKWVSWRRHRVRRGETLSVIARRYGTSVQGIVEVNGISRRSLLRIGQELIIPVGSARAAAVPATRTSPGTELTRYRVRRGDTLSGIAQRFGVSVADLRRWNGLRSDRIISGAVLRVQVERPPVATAQNTRPPAAEAALTTVAAPSDSASAAGPPRTHRVKPGETLWSIARAYRTTVEAIRATNQFLFERQLQAGDELRIAAPR